MDILKEVIRGFSRDDEEDTPNDDLEFNLDGDEDLEHPQSNELSFDIDEDPEDEFDDLNIDVPDDLDASPDNAELEGDDDLSLDGEEPDDGLDNVAQAAIEDKSKQGVLRAVKNAHLVYKRETGTGGYEELWIYNVGNLKDELVVRKAILAGTDIPPGQTSSEDGSQTYTLWSAGNAELLHITGLQN